MSNIKNLCLVLLCCWCCCWCSCFCCCCYAAVVVVTLNSSCYICNVCPLLWRLNAYYAFSLHKRGQTNTWYLSICLNKLLIFALNLKFLHMSEYIPHGHCPRYTSSMGKHSQQYLAFCVLLCEWFVPRPLSTIGFLLCWKCFNMLNLISFESTILPLHTHYLNIIVSQGHKNLTYKCIMHLCNECSFFLSPLLTSCQV